MASIRQPWIARRSLISEDYKHMRLPDAYKDLQLNALPVEARRRDLFEYIKNLKDNAGEGRGVFLYGDHVEYRTASAVGILKAFKSHGQQCMFFGFEEFKLESRRSFFADKDTELMKKAQSCQILLIDEVNEAGDSTFLKSLDVLIGQRSCERFVTIITTKSHPQQWSRAFPEHVRAWLGSHCIKLEYGTLQIQGFRDERRHSNG